jgi:hypothetical protein
VPLRGPESRGRDGKVEYIIRFLEDVSGLTEILEEFFPIPTY